MAEQAGARGGGGTDAEEVARLARLARLDVTEAECEDWAPKVGAVLEWFAQLQEVRDLGSLEPQMHMCDTNSAAPLRPDVPQDWELQAQILSQAPQTTGGQVSIPRITAEE